MQKIKFKEIADVKSFTHIDNNYSKVKYFVFYNYRN
jgi:hypothetical protein